MKNSQPKRYRLLTQDGYRNVTKGLIYPEDYQVPTDGDFIRDCVRNFPHDWELVPDEPEPFTPTHICLGGKEVVFVRQTDETSCIVRDKTGMGHEVDMDDLTPIQRTILTEQQHNSLVKAIYSVIMNSNDELDMADMGEAHETAEETVRQWAEKNQINLP